MKSEKYCPKQLMNSNTEEENEEYESNSKHDRHYL